MPGTTRWFAAHEFRLLWRDWLFMMTAGHRARARNLIIALAIAIIVLHALAAAMVASWSAGTLTAGKPLFVTLTGTGLLSLCLMVSQSLETITRAYYQRADLDLILTSPAPATRLFALRTLMAGLSTAALSALLFAPLINMLAIMVSPLWLAAYPVLISLGGIATAISVQLTGALFALFGARRTRLAAQILAAIVGAGFLIGIQAAAILSFGRISQYDLFSSEALLSYMPSAGSPLYWPARAATGDPLPLIAIIATGALALWFAVRRSAKSFAVTALAAAASPELRHKKAAAAHGFSKDGPLRALVRKEFRLLLRDPWLLSQTLMQILYLLPPALLLFVNYGEATGAFAIIAPVVTMAAGQLGGGLAWLAISGEDAPDLVETAPIHPALVLRAKTLSVFIALGAVLTPILMLLALADPYAGFTALCGASLAAGSALTIQLWFRTRARRAQFRRRQTASRTATLSEALVSIMWAGTAGIAAAGHPAVALVPAALALGTLALVRKLRPPQNR